MLVMPSRVGISAKAMRVRCEWLLRLLIVLCFFYKGLFGVVGEVMMKWCFLGAFDNLVLRSFSYCNGW